MECGVEDRVERTQEHEETGRGDGRRRRTWVALGLGAAMAIGAMTAAPVRAQETDRVRVFMDCQMRGCPQEEFRTEIGFVDWVRERTAADLHVIITSQNAGAGRAITFDVVGRNDFEDADMTVRTDVSDTATQEERLRALTRTFEAALAGYVARRGYADQLDIRAREVEAASGGQDREEDPWRLWVFTLGTQVEASGEEQQERYEVGARFNANRTTPDWKINIGLDGEFSEQTFVLSQGTFVNQRDNWELDALVVRSLTPHWSAGTESEINTSTALNREVGGRVAAALEWNYFPYEQANRRQLLVHYQIGYSHVRYEEETIFDKLEEDLFDHRIVAAWQSRQPWGDGSLIVGYSAFLHDPSKYRVAVGGDMSIRLLRGLELEVRGRYERIQDQIYLPKEDLDDEEILVQRRQLATGYEYDVEVGLSYRFGSIFNNVVNNRFPWIVRRF